MQPLVMPLCLTFSSLAPMWLNAVALDIVCYQYLTRATKWCKNVDHSSFHSPRYMHLNICCG